MARLEVRAGRTRKWRRLLLWAIPAIAVLAAACLGASLAGAWLRHAMWRQLPVLDGELRLPGLSAPVTVRRDQHGIPHIQAANMDDLLEAQGFVTAQDRLWQMDMARRYSAGELAEILGPLAVQHDKLQRVLWMRPTAERLTASMPAAQKRLFEDYSRGVNAFIQRQQGHLPAEFRLLDYQPAPWQPIDSWLVALNLVAQLDTLYPEKLDREAVEAKLAPGLAEQLYPTITWRDHPPPQVAPEPAAQEIEAPTDTGQPVPGSLDPGSLDPGSLDPGSPDPGSPDLGLLDPGANLSSRRAPGPDDLLQLQRVLDSFATPCGLCRPGSNEWAVSGARTASGKALLSNDMHLQHQIPNIWYQEDLEAGSFHVEGVTTPGIPLIIAGHNAHVAWGFTTLNGDVQDVYVEKTNAQGEYWENGEWREPEHGREHILVRGGRDVTLDLERTVHGPVITPLVPHEHRMLALKWTLYDPAAAGLPLEELDAAGNWAEFRAALSRWWGPTENVVYADDQGHIGYQAVGLFPLRPAGLSGTPIVESGTAADGLHEWRGWIPFQQLPNVLDPPEGFVATANSRITPDGYPYPLALDWAEPYRNERIWKWLGNKDKLTAADMLALQTDTYSEVDRELAQRFAAAIDHASNTDARLRRAAGLLRAWDGRVRADSEAAEIVDAAKHALWPLILQPKLGRAWLLYVWQDKDFAQEEMVANTPARWLPAGYQSWNDLIAAAVSKGMKDGHAPRSLTGWSYGSRHEIDLRHPLYGLLPFFGWTGTGAHPLPGDETTVDQTRGRIGPSQRFTIDWSDVDGSTENIVMGESGDPVSPYYRDQWPYWYGGRTFAVTFTDAAVNAAAKHTLLLTP